MPQSVNVLGFGNYKEALAVHKENCQVSLQGQVDKSSESEALRNHESHVGPVPAAAAAAGADFTPISQSQTSVSDDNSSITAVRNPNILFDFDSDSASDSREQNNILLCFDSDSGVDEEDIEYPENMENQELDARVHAGGVSRKPGDKYTEFDFDFLEEDWLEITDDGSDEVSSSSSSTDR